MMTKLYQNRIAIVLTVLGIVVATLLAPLAVGTTVAATPAEQPQPPVPQPVDDGDLMDPSIPDLVGGKVWERQPSLVEPAPAQQPQAADAPDAPTIDVWYGNTQTFGTPGEPQEQINILGNVSGEGPFTLSYTLNGGASMPLSVGGQPDVGNEPGDNASNPRLASAGDFNVEIQYAALSPGNNTLVINAEDTNGATTNQNVTVVYDDGNTWPANYSTNWATAGAIGEEAQPVDGKWSLDGGTIRTVEIGYDRAIALGDINAWQDYEVTVPFTVRAINRGGVGNGAGVGLIVRWRGHFAVDNDQPTLGWRRLGALGWYRWAPDGTEALELRGHEGNFISSSTAKQVVVDAGNPQQYIMKLSIQSSDNPDQNAFYRFKFWPAGQAEPADWDLQGFGKDGEPTAGSVLLLAHNADVSFGNVQVRRLSDITLTLSTATNSLDGTGTGTIDQDPEGVTEFAYGDRVVLEPEPGPGSEFVGWTGDYTGVGDVANNNRLLFNITQDIDVTANFQAGTPKTLTVNEVGDGTVTKSPDKEQYDKDEVVTLTAVPAPGKALLGWSGDATGSINPINVVMDRDKTITATFGDPEIVPPPVSDDFNRCTLDGAVWSFVDPVGDADFEVDGQQLSMIVPGGAAHDPWQREGDLRTNNGVRLIQAADDGDFTVEARFTSALNAESASQILGIIAETDADTFLRFDLYSDGSLGNPEIKAFAGYMNDGAVFNRVPAQSVATPTAGPYLLQVTREGNTWTFRYSLDDGATWNDDSGPVLSFSQTMEVVKVGIHTGNAKNNPAYTAVVDYFFNTAAPISPEDGKGYGLTTNEVGQGSVAVDPDKETYVCGESVEVEATAAAGWRFVGWGGAVVGTQNPQSFNFDMGATVTATFTDSTEPLQFTLDVDVDPIGAGNNVTKSPDQPTYTEGSTVRLTAVPGPGQRFDRWEGDVTGTTNPIDVEMTGNKSVIAIFGEDNGETKYELNVIVTPSGSGTVTKDPNKSAYLPDEEVTLTAVPAEGYRFAGWGGDATGNSRTTTVTMDNSDKTVSATFVEGEDEEGVYLPIIRN